MTFLLLLCRLSVSISFENYRMVHPYEESDSSEDEVDWQDTRHDPYRAGRVLPSAATRGRAGCGSRNRMRSLKGWLTHLVSSPKQLAGTLKPVYVV